VSSTEFNTELNTICAVRDSTIRLTIQSWQLDWRSDNSTGSSALQFGLTIPLTIRTYHFVWRIRTYKFDLQLALIILEAKMLLLRCCHAFSKQKKI